MENTINRGAGKPRSSIPVSPMRIPRINTVGLPDIKKWLRLGWQDLKTNPAASLAYGVVFAIVGMLLTNLASHQPTLVVAAITGFFLVGPFLAVGLYDLSRRIEFNHPASLLHSMGAIRNNTLGLGIYAVALGIVMVVWVRIAALLVAIQFDGSPVTGEGLSGLFTSLISMQGGWFFLLIFTAAGLLVAAAAFATGVVTAPLMLHKKVDIVTAGATSVRAVRANPLVMLVWAITIVAFVGIGLLTFFVGLIITMPIIAHASWHAYRDLVSHQDEA